MGGAPHGEGASAVEYSLSQRRRLWLYTFLCPAIDRFARIVRRIAPPEEIFDSPPAQLESIVGAETLARMRRLNTDAYIDALIERLEARGVSVICRGDDDYPECFEQLTDFIVAPEVLFVRGAHEFPGRAVAVVGTRACTPDGARIASDFARDFARAGVAVVSGMAVGIDASAVEGALDGGGRALCVLGCGVDVPYPAENQKLVRRMLEAGGTLVSEYLPGMGANRAFFPVRNRIIAALAAGTLVVQAPARSGALNTATHALNCGRDVFVVPGSILDAKFAGSNALLRDGAAPALESRDVLEMLGFVRVEAEQKTAQRSATQAAPEPGGLTDDELTVVRLLYEGERSFDEIISQTELDTAKLNSLLTMLKIKGIIDETTGKHYRISGRAKP